MIKWITCFLCRGYGKIDIGDNHNPFSYSKNLQCPICKNVGKIAVKENPDLNKDRKDYL